MISPVAESRAAHRAQVRSTPLTLGQILHVCWRRRRPAGLAAGGFLAVLLIFSYLVTPLYMAQGSLAVEPGANAMSITAQDEDGRVDFGFLNTERDRILSRPVLQRVVERAELSKRAPYSASREPTGLLRLRIDITTSRENWVLAIRLKDENAKEAERMLQLLVESYKETARAERSAIATSAAGFFKEQMDAAQAKIDLLRSEEDKLRLERRIVSADPDRNSYVVAADAINRQITEADLHLTSLQVVMGQVREVLVRSDADQRTSAFLRISRIGRDGQVIAAAQVVSEMEAKAVQMEQQYGPRHPTNVAFKAEMSGAKRQLDEAIALAIGALELDIRGAEHQIGELRKQLDRTKTELSQYRNDLAMLQAIHAKIRPNEAILEQITRRSLEEEIASQRTATNISVIDPPKAGYAPVNVHRKAVALVGSALAVLILISVALLVEIFDRRIRSVADLRAISDLPLLGQVPMLSLPASGKRLVGQGEAAEPFRELAATIQLGIRLHQQAPLILVVPVSPGDGASVVAGNLAAALAEGQRRTLVIDADMRRPAAHLVLHAEPGPDRGLSLLLSDPSRDIEAMPTGVAGLDLIPAGPIPPSPPALLAHDEFRSVLASVRSEYDMVVVDCPPLAVVGDARLITDYADAVLLVCREGLTTKAALNTALDRLAHAHGRLLGLVLNGTSKPIDVSTFGYVPDQALTERPVAAAAPADSPTGTGARRLLVGGTGAAVVAGAAGAAGTAAPARKETDDDDPNSVLVIPD